MKIDILIKQSKINQDFNTVIDIIKPFIVDRKITKREIDKAQKAINEHFGAYHTTETGKIIPFYSLTIDKQSLLSKCIHIYAYDRSIDIENKTYYIKRDKRVIYLRYKKATNEELDSWKCKKKHTPTEREIWEAYTQFIKYTKEIESIKEKIHKLPFYYYF